MKFRLKELRTGMGLTQEEMSDRLGISVGLYNGLETGKRRMNADYIEAAAAIFGIRPAALIDDPETGPDASGAGGFAEQAEPWDASPGTRNAVAGIYADVARNPAAVHRATVDLPAFGVQAGDLLVCDLSRLPQPGDLAVLTISDPGTDNSHTLIRRFVPPFLLPGTVQMQGDPELADNPNVTPRYPVVGIIRGASLP